MEKLCPYIWSFLSILLSMPALIAGSDKSLFKHKGIKAYLISSRSQERFISLATLPTEKKQRSKH